MRQFDGSSTCAVGLGTFGRIVSVNKHNEYTMNTLREKLLQNTDFYFGAIHMQFGFEVEAGIDFRIYT